MTHYGIGSHGNPWFLWRGGGDWALTNCQNGTIEDQIWNNKPENVRFMIWSSRIIFSFGFGMYAFEHELKEIEKIEILGGLPR